MKKLFLFLLVLLVPVVYAGNNVNVDLVGYTPFPVVPGTDFEITFLVDNLGEATEVELILSGSGSFFLDGSGRKIVNLEAGRDKEVTYRVNVEIDTDEDEDEINIEWCVSDECKNEDFDIKIEKSVILKIVSFNSDPKILTPGRNAELDLNFENQGTTLIRDIIISLDFDDLPFAPSESSLQQTITSLRESVKKIVTFDIVTLSNANSGIYKIPVNLDYKDEFGIIHQEKSVISLRVTANPDLDVLLDGFGIVNQVRRVNVEFVNKGLGDIQFLDVELLAGNYDVIGSNKVYIGDVDSDDIETVSFDLKINEKQVLLPIFVKYMDDDNNFHSDVLNLNLITYDEKEAKNLGLVESNNSMLIFVVIFVVIILFFVVRRIRKKKK